MSAVNFFRCKDSHFELYWSHVNDVANFRGIPDVMANLNVQYGISPALIADGHLYTFGLSLNEVPNIDIPNIPLTCDFIFKINWLTIVPYDIEIRGYNSDHKEQWLIDLSDFMTDPLVYISAKIISGYPDFYVEF